MDCSRGNDLYGIEDINVITLSDGSGYCPEYSQYRGAMSAFSAFPQSETCYWLGINHLGGGMDENGSWNDNGTGSNSAIGLLYSSASECEYNPTFLGSTWGIGLGLVMYPQNIGPDTIRLWHIFGR